MFSVRQKVYFSPKPVLLVYSFFVFPKKLAEVFVESSTGYYSFYVIYVE